MPYEQYTSAHDAARLLGKPTQAKTFARRAHEAYRQGDMRVQLSAGRVWLAPMSFWRSIKLRQSGRPAGSRNRQRGQVNLYPIPEKPRRPRRED